MIKKLHLIAILFGISFGCCANEKWYKNLNIVVINKSGKDIAITKFGKGTVSLKKNKWLRFFHTHLIHPADDYYTLQWFIGAQIGTINIRKDNENQNNIIVTYAFTGWSPQDVVFDYRKGSIIVTINKNGTASITQSGPFFMPNVFQTLHTTGFQDRISQ